MSDVINNFKKLEYHAKIKSICHHRMANFYKKILYYIEYPCVILSFISTSTIILEIIQQSDIYDLFVLNFITFIMVLIANITKIFRIGQKMEDHHFYSKEYSKIYRNILNSYDYIDEFYNYKINLNISENDNDMLEKISNFHFNKFISQISNQIHFLAEDEPIIFKNIMSTVYEKENDIYFYHIQTKDKKNNYTIDQLIYIYNLDEKTLYDIIKFIYYNLNYQSNNTGKYRHIDLQTANKKAMLNYIILEKNISYSLIYKISKSNIDMYETELQTISIVDNSMDL